MQLTRIFLSTYEWECHPRFVQWAPLQTPFLAWELVIAATFRDRKALPTD